MVIPDPRDRYERMGDRLFYGDIIYGGNRANDKEVSWDGVDRIPFVDLRGYNRSVASLNILIPVKESKIWESDLDLLIFNVINNVLTKCWSVSYEACCCSCIKELLLLFESGVDLLLIMFYRYW